MSSNGESHSVDPPLPDANNSSNTEDSCEKDGLAVADKSDVDSSLNNQHADSTDADTDTGNTKTHSDNDNDDTSYNNDNDVEHSTERLKGPPKRLYFSDGESVNGSESSSASCSPTSSCNNNNNNNEGCDSNGEEKREKKKKKKRKKEIQTLQRKQTYIKKRQRAIFDDSDSDSDSPSHPEDESANMDVSLNDLKYKILGRSIQSSITTDTNNKNSNDSTDQKQQYLQQLQQALQASSSQHQQHQDVLKKELSCAICHDPLYEPLSLPCGHSFCGQCLKWWLEHSSQLATTTLTTTMSVSGSSSFGKCPTCRSELTVDISTCLKVNTALRACVQVLFPIETTARQAIEQEALKKATVGENCGAHSRGYEELSSLQQENWIAFRSDDGPSRSRSRPMCGCIAARRSIVLDAHDQRMQLALALTKQPEETIVTAASSCTSTTTFYSQQQQQQQHQNDGNVRFLDIEICLLQMEEDEAGDGEGFPIILREAEGDEHFISKEDRFLSSFVTCAAEVQEDDGTMIQNVPVARKYNDTSDAVVQFRIDRVGCFQRAVALLFRHKETGAELEIRLDVASTAASGKQIKSSFQSSNASEKRRIKSAAQRQREKDEEDDDDEDDGCYGGGRNNLDEFENDGFVVMNEEEGDFDENYDEESSGEDNDDDVCYLCREHGELIVCDGGNNIVTGCGRSFHLSCVKRTVTPPGDWICQTCAKAPNLSSSASITCGLSVDNVNAIAAGGLEGYEFAATNDADAESSDESIDILPQQQQGGSKANAPKRKCILPDSDED